MIHAHHVGHAQVRIYANRWKDYLSEKLDKWVQFHLFWHGAFHNATVSADGKIRKPEDLLIVRCA